MNSKASNFFSKEFVFDEDDTNNGFIPNKPPIKNKRKQRSIEDVEEPVELDNFDDDKNGKINEIINKKDHLRIKESSVKKNKTDNEDFFEKPTKTKLSNSFEDMNISKPLLKAVADLNFHKPTEIQASCIPLALMGKDICACAVTGSGKTLAFMLPTLERLLYKPKFPQVTRVLVLTPTRELAAQICKVTRDIAQHTNIQICLCAGGFDIKTQEAALRLGPDICVATPGRLIDHLHNTPSFNIDTVEILILDEADRMLDEYFAEQLKEIMRLCSKTHQTMLFSATMTDKVDDLIRVSLNKPVKVFINDNIDIAPLLKQEFIRVRDYSDLNKQSIVASLITRKFNERVIVFVRTKVDCHRLCLLLNLLDIRAAELHGSLTQTQRLEKLNEFKEEKLNVLVATDLAARGLDIINVKTVINYSMPISYKHYVHRVGRTARAGNSGRSISLVTENDRWLVKEILKSTKIPVKARVIPPDVIKVYKDKIGVLHDKFMDTLEEEKNEKLIDKMQTQIEYAEKKMNKKDKNKTPTLKRTWLPDVDYKNGGLKKDNIKKKKLLKKKEKETKKKNKQNSEEDDNDNDDFDNDDDGGDDDDGDDDFDE